MGDVLNELNKTMSDIEHATIASMARMFHSIDVKIDRNLKGYEYEIHISQELYTKLKAIKPDSPSSCFLDNQ